MVIFALQNTQAVTVWFLFCQLQSSLAAVALATTAAGVLMIAELFEWARRLLRWKRRGPATEPAGSTGSPSGPGHPGD